MKCEHEGCKERANEWCIPWNEPPAIFHFCDDHAAEFGFCLTCGNFIGGTEDVFLTGQDGLCFECFIQVRDELESDERFDYDDDDWIAEYDYTEGDIGQDGEI